MPFKDVHMQLYLNCSDYNLVVLWAYIILISVILTS